MTDSSIGFFLFVLHGLKQDSFMGKGIWDSYFWKQTAISKKGTLGNFVDQKKKKRLIM